MAEQPILFVVLHMSQHSNHPKNECVKSMGKGAIWNYVGEICVDGLSTTLYHTFSAVSVNVWLFRYLIYQLQMIGV